MLLTIFKTIAIVGERKQKIIYYSRMALSKLTEWIAPGKKCIYNFSEGCLDDRSILGYKGAMLCEMRRIKVPIPDGFIVSSDACTDYLFGEGDEKPSRIKHTAQLPIHLCSDIHKHIHKLEKSSGKLFGVAPVEPKTAIPPINTPLLLSIRVSTRIPLKGKV